VWEEVISKKRVSDVGREMVHWLVEVVSKRKMSDAGWDIGADIH